MSERPPENHTLRFIKSPLWGKDLVSTFVAAQILFPHLPKERLTKSHLRFVQRLCQYSVLEAYKIGRRYYIVRQSILDYREENHYRRNIKRATD